MPLQQAPASSTPRAAEPARTDSAPAGPARTDSVLHTGTIATLPGHVDASGPARLLFEQDKLYTVVAVLLIVWLGLAMLLLHNDRRLAKLERQLPGDP